MFSIKKIKKDENMTYIEICKDVSVTVHVRFKRAIDAIRECKSSCTTYHQNFDKLHPFSPQYQNIASTSNPFLTTKEFREYDNIM